MAKPPPPSEPPPPPPLKYPKPKIMLIDIAADSEKALRDAGYNVDVGTFGRPYAVSRSDELLPVAMSTAKLHNVREQEIVIVDVASRPPLHALPPKPGNGVESYWQRCLDGEIDPRPLFMHSYQDVFDTVWSYGGIFIVIAAAEYSPEYIIGSAHQYRNFQRTKELSVTNWSFLSALKGISVKNHMGEELVITAAAKEFGDVIRRGSDDAYECTVDAYAPLADNWVGLAQTKYGEDVAGMWMGGDPPRTLLILPRMPRLQDVIVELIEEWCPRWHPRLFPDHEANVWVHLPQYEAPRVLEVESRIAEVQNNARQRIAELEAEIVAAREEYAHLHAILRESGDALVAAVIRCLKEIGFQSVVDVDKEMESQGSTQDRREDLRIEDARPTLIVDVKGVAGRPDDEDSRQAEKHAIMRIREWNRTDVQPLTIVNHERHLPPHLRERVGVGTS